MPTVANRCTLTVFTDIYFILFYLFTLLLLLSDATSYGEIKIVISSERIRVRKSSVEYIYGITTELIEI